MLVADRPCGVANHGGLVVSQENPQGANCLAVRSLVSGVGLQGSGREAGGRVDFKGAAGRRSGQSRPEHPPNKP